jgi:hypothetical protein
LLQKWDETTDYKKEILTTIHKIKNQKAWKKLFFRGNFYNKSTETTVMFKGEKRILMYLFSVLIYTTFMLSVPAGNVVSKTNFQDSFEAKSLKSVWRQSDRSPGPKTLVEISDKAAFDGKKSILLYDNDPKQAVTLDYVGKFPQSGAISGYLMFPKNAKGLVNSNRAYTAIQVFGTKRNCIPIIMAISASKQNATISMRKDGKRVNIAVLSDIVSLDAWVPWRIAWQWDGKSTEGTCRITIGDKETDTFVYPASKFTRLRLVSGWSSVTNNSVYYDSISIKSGGTLTASPTKQEIGAFVVKKVKTVFSDTFNKINPTDSKLPAGWTHWQPASDGGKAVYERNYGRGDSSSLCFINNMRCWWQRKRPVTPGKTYRFSGWVKVQQSSKGKVGLHIIPKVISKSTGKEIFLSKHTSLNEIKLSPGFWNYLEVFWTAPASGDYPEGKLVGVDIAFSSKNLSGKAWCDDVALDEVVIEKPFRENFLKKTASLKAWKIFSHSGLEGVAKVAYASPGFADPGAIEIKHLKGKTGAFSAATILDRDTLGAKRQWTLLAHARAQGKGKPSLSIQQLDGNDKILLHTTGADLVKAADGWSKYQLTFSLLTTTKKLRLQLVNGGKGSAIFDNVWLRPATANEKAMTDAAKKLPVWMNIFPADAFAIVDDMPAVLRLSRGQTNAFCIQLAGDDKPGETTIVDVDMPDWLTLRTAQIATYGQEPLKYEKIQSVKGRVTYRFKNPYNWQRAMVRGNPNPYHGLLMVVNANAKAGTEDQIVIRTSLGKAKGEERKLKFIVSKALPPVPKLKKFKVGLWVIGWLNVRDITALKELYKTYVGAGIKIGAMHSTHGFASKPLQEVGFSPAKIIHGPSHIYSYKHSGQRPDMMILADGKNASHKIALGLALNDPATHQAYKKYVAKDLKVLPKYSSYVISDIEFWGEGSTSRSCFHPSTIKAFRKYANIPESTKLTSAIILKQYYKQWSGFRNWVTAELHALMRRTIRDIRPDLQLLAYDYTLKLDGTPPFGPEAPMDTLLYDPNVDIHLISYYNFEGTQFLDHVDNDAKHLKKPVWAVPFIVDSVNSISNPNWNYHHPSAKEIRLEIVGAAASGAKGFLPFTGYLLGADRLQAYSEGVTAVAKYESFYMDGKRSDKEVALVNPDSNVRYRVHELDGKLLLTLFNCGNKDLKITFKFNDKPKTASVKAHDFKQLNLKK